MGMIDHVEIEEGVDLPEFPNDPTQPGWQTKSFQPCDMTVYKITEDGRLLEEEWHLEDVPKEERPYPDADEEKEPFKALAGSMEKVVDGWSEREYHGILNFYDSVVLGEGKTRLDDDVQPVWFEYNATFTHGELEDVQRVPRE